jgi:hypothetical protein
MKKLNKEQYQVLITLAKEEIIEWQKFLLDCEKKLKKEK